jgi:hypothetical protein
VALDDCRAENLEWHASMSDRITVWLSHPRGAILASGLIYVAITAWIGRDVLSSLGTTIAGDPGDPILNAAILAWNSVQVPWTSAWFQFPIFHPTPGALTLSEHLLGISVVATPIYWVTGNALTTYNLTLLLSYPLSGLAMFLLVRRLTGSTAAAFLSGLAFAFAPYRASQLPHIQMLASFWAPLALLGLHRFLQALPPLVEGALDATKTEVCAGPRDLESGSPRSRLRWVTLFAICWILQGAANSYLLVYFTVLIGLWVLWFLVTPGRFRDAALVTVAGAIALVPLVPILYRYLTGHYELGLSRNLGEIAAFGADIAAPLCAPPSLTFWGWLRLACAPEGELFAGATLLALCVSRLVRGGRAGEVGGVGRAGEGVPGADRQGRVRIVIRRLATGVACVYVLIAVSVLALGPWRFDLGWLRASASSADKPMSVALGLLLVALLVSSWLQRVVRRGSTATFYLAAAIVCWVLSWGPFPRLFGSDALYQAPFAWLLQLPGVGGLRVPARFWMMTVMCLVIFMGFAVAALLAGRGRRASFVIISAAACGLVADGLMTIPAAAMPSRLLAADAAPGATVLMLPLGIPPRDTRAVYDAVNGGWRSINGYSGYEPGYYEALRTMAHLGDPALFQPLRVLGDMHVVVDEGDSSMPTLVERQPGSQLVRRADGQRWYWLPRRDGDEPAAPPLGRMLTPVGLSASCSPEGLVFATDDDIDTRWVCGIQNAAHQVTFDLGVATVAGAIVHALGTAGADFPRHLVVETSLDGQQWETAWQGSPAAAVLRAAMAAPRATRAVFSFTPRPARYVRLRQTSRHAINYWSIAEFEVWTGE